MSMLTITLLVLVPLLVWRVYARLQGMLGRQSSVMARHLMGVTGCFGLWAVIASSLPFASYPMLTAGLAAGVLLAWFAFRRTRLEVTDQGYFFTPDRLSGSAVAMLLFARVLYIGVDGYWNQATNAQMLTRFTDNALSLALLGLVCGYFGTTSARLLLWRRRQRKTEWQA